jgi:chromosome segregation ATPase
MAISAGVRLAVQASLSDQLVTLRRAFDERLSALEAGLSDPDHCPSLESLVLDLTRVAVEEAEAAARDIIRQARREAAEQTAAATADAQESHTRLDAERTQAASLRTEVAVLTEKLARAAANRDAVDTERQQEVEELTATVGELRKALDDSKRVATKNATSLASELERVNAAMRERDFFAQARDTITAERDRLQTERDKLKTERDRLTSERDTLKTERDGILAERDALVQQRDALQQQKKSTATNQETLVAERATLAKERDVLSIERDEAVSERDSILTEREKLAAERDALVTERDRLLAERDEFVRSHDALALQRDMIAHERDEIRRDRDDVRKDRDREIAKLREEFANAAPPATAPSAPKPADVEQGIAEMQEELTRRQKKGAPAKTQQHAHSPARKSRRQAFPNALGVQIDGEAALLVDLSVTGAQVLSCSALKPAKNIKLLLPSAGEPVLCRGRVVWARIEPPMPGKPIRYRAGVSFTSTDAAAVQSFMARHGNH